MLMLICRYIIIHHNYHVSIAKLIKLK